ncbi:MAG TPA: hypothetical protein VFX35_01585 [Solirubrobacterales bacterium]|nr:hypothetical protein [Solirubrobacterales bacterium]
MADPAKLHNSQVPAPDPELVTAEILDDATAPGEEVSCLLEGDGPTLRSDPMRWTPHTVEGEGTWFPKRGNAALVGIPADGAPPWIVAWAPAPGAVPDVLA